ncbi:MAG TPA: hypothetical protein VFL38_00285 [Humibacillus xanthopallidus]|nr:hypothetical protein [Humibacillus xanthopallidus]
MTATPPDLPVDVLTLAAIDLRRAQVQDWRQERDAFSWTLLTGDADRGHELVAITYVGAVVLHVNGRELDAAVRGAAEVARSEVVPAAQGGYEHHVTLRAAYRLVVRFWSVDLRRMPAPDHLRRHHP